MKRVLASILVAGLAVLAFSTDSFAGLNANAKIQLHLLGTTSKNDCARLTATPACNGIIVQGNLYPAAYFAYVLVTDGNASVGIAGLQFGIQYTGPGALDGVGVDVYSWKLCATLEFITPTVPAWPNSGTGTLITWDPLTRCQVNEPGGPGTGVVADAGYFYCGSYSPATFAIIPRPVDGVAKVASCDPPVEDIVTTGTPSHLGSVGFGGQPGYNPCGLITPVKSTTWSNVKSIYSND